MKPPSTPAERVRFFESDAPNALALLDSLAERLRNQGAAVEHLSSSGQPGLYLLIARGGEGELDSPSGVRQWDFVVIA